MNGFTDKDQLEKIEKVELTLEDLGRMLCVNAFKNLKALTLINVGIQSIEGLEDLGRLEDLCLNENQI